MNPSGGDESIFGGIRRLLLCVQMCLYTGPTVRSAIGGASKFTDLISEVYLAMNKTSH